MAPPPCAGSDAATPWGPLVFEYRTESSGSWQRLEVIHDGTVALARTGVVFLRVPPVADGGQARLRLRLDRGLFPIAPRLVRVAFNVLPIVQLETRPEAVLGRSDGLPDQRFKVDLAGLPSGGGDGPAAERLVPQAPPHSATDTWALEEPRKALASREWGWGEGCGATSSIPPRSTSRGGGGPCDTGTDRDRDAAGYQPLRVEVQEGGEFRQWQKVEDLTACGPADRACEIDIRSGDIRFGNGVNGRVPPKDAQILCRSYHLTEGSQGNLRAGLGWRVAGAPTGSGVYGSNPVPLSGGADAWDVDLLRQRAREIVLQRNVLLRDCELQQAALGLPGYGVARAEVVPRFHPAFPRADMAHARTLVVIPWRGPDEGAPPSVGEAYADAVAAALSPRRVLGERLTVMAARRVPVRVRAKLLVEDGVDAQRLRAEASDRLDARLTDIAVDDQVAPWPVGRTVTVGEIKTLLAGIDRVIAVPTCELAREEGGFAAQPIPLLRYEVATGGRHEIEVRTLATE